MIEGVVGFALVLLATAAGGSEPATLGTMDLLAVATAYVLAGAGLELLVVRGLRRRLLGARARPPGALSFWAACARVFGHFLLLGLGWRSAVGELLGALAPLADLAATLPWVASYLLASMLRRPLLCALRRRPWPLGSWVAFHLRLLVVPGFFVGVLIAQERFVADREALQELVLAFPSLATAMTIALVIAALALSPYVVRLALPGRSLPDGSLRRRILALAERQRFRFVDVRVIATRGHVVNAAFLGLFGRGRYVLLSDGLMDRLDDEQLLGVFAHEMGHARRRHIPMNLALFAAFTIAAGAISAVLAPGPAAATGWADMLVPLIALPLFVLFVFAPIARGFELESDAYAMRVLGGADPIRSALARLGDLQPHKRARGGLVHPPLLVRLAWLRAYEEEPERLDVRLGSDGRRLRARILATLLLALLILLATLPEEIARGTLTLAVGRAHRDDDAAGAGAALALLHASRPEVRDPDGRLEMLLRQVIATDLQDAGDLAGAAEHVAWMAEHEEALPMPEQRYNAALIAARQAATEGRWPELVRHLGRAATHLDAVAASRGEDDPEVIEEREALRFFDVVVMLLERAGLLATTRPHPDAVSGLGDHPSARALIALWEADGAEARRAAAALAREDDPAWRRLLVARLAELP